MNSKSQTYSLSELTSHHDEKFVQNAYIAILNRAPDKEGFKYYLSRIRSGVSKIELLVQLRTSPEGVAVNSQIQDLDNEVQKYNAKNKSFFGKLSKFINENKVNNETAKTVRSIDNKFSVFEERISNQLRDINQTMILRNINKSEKQEEETKCIFVQPAAAITEKINLVVSKKSALVPVSHAALSSHLGDPLENDSGITQDKSKLIAFYLPQFHRTKENSEWWGPGFTEWTNAANAKPNFKGHVQPHVPRELGFYDLSKVDIMHEQAALAKTYGVHGFCFYYYWFSGRRILELPLDNFLNSDVDMEFCLCWANENWTRAWDGDEKSVLLEQGYADGDEDRFIDDILPFLKDSRYVKVNGKPMLVVYRIKQLPDPVNSIKKWRAAAVRNGLEGLHVAVVDFYDISDPDEVGADALVEFPPHKFNGPQNHPNPMPEFTNPLFAGGMVDYEKIVAQSASREQPDFTLYRGIIPGWDNTARRQNTPTTIVNNTPELYGQWLSYLRSYSRVAHAGKSESMIFVNAWNEWGEGCHLEPDLQWGLKFLEETLRSTWFDPNDEKESANHLKEKILTMKKN